MQANFLYVHGKDVSIDVLNRNDLTFIGNINTDKKRIITGKEIGDKYFFAGCEGGLVFLFEISGNTFTRIGKSDVGGPACSSMVWSNDIVITG